jgi:pimeloyl-ACP methyl ester carboxylesterase
MTRFLVVAALLALATWAHYLFWSWRLRLPDPADETLRATTGDGWSLALARRRPRAAVRPVPVLLVHGIAANHLCMDFPMARLSLAAHLAEAGFDCFSVDLRGHGRSGPGRGARRRWDFDDYVKQDLPAAVAAVRRATGAEQVAVVGHSQGALLGMAACGTVPDRVAALVAIAGPAWFRAPRPIALAARFAFLFTGRLNRFLARCLAPFAGWFRVPLGDIAWNANNVDGPVYRRVLANVVEDVPRGVLREFAEWIRTNTWRSIDGEVDYRALIGRARQPALFVAAEDDRLAPPAIVRLAHDHWGGERAYWVAGKEGGLGAPYGHSDLLFGRRAPEEVFPRIAEWLIRVTGASTEGELGPRS